jgi:hypothetical protein
MQYYAELYYPLLLLSVLIITNPLEGAEERGLWETVVC